MAEINIFLLVLTFISVATAVYYSSKTKSDTSRDDFTSTVVHELRTPLSGINKISELLRNNGQEMAKADFDQYIKLINGESASMLSIINDILDYSKLKSGKFQVRKEMVDIKKIIDNRLDFFRPSSEDASIKLLAVYDPELPKEVFVDQGGIKQVLNNLIYNSIKFANTGSTATVFAIHHKTGVDVREETERLSVKPVLGLPQDKLSHLRSALIVGVSDLSPGISEGEMKELFVRFKQLSAKSNLGQKGSGLGLSIAKAIIEGHDGTLDVVSKKDLGSVFFFAVPL
jgi:signal transduction histidine kinase